MFTENSRSGRWLPANSSSPSFIVIKNRALMSSACMLRWGFSGGAFPQQGYG